MTAKNEIAKKLTPMSGESNVKSYADGRSPPVCSEGTDFSPNTNHQSTLGLEQTRRCTDEWKRHRHLRVTQLTETLLKTELTL